MIKRLALYSIFDEKTCRPRCTAIGFNNEIVVRELYRPGAGKTIYSINRTIKEVRRVIVKAIDSGCEIITSDFKSHIHAFDLPMYRSRCNVYDTMLPTIRAKNPVRDAQAVSKIIERMMLYEPKECDKIVANAAVVYSDMELNGVFLNYEKVYPVWSQRTFSGRSKTTGFNIQGLTDHVMVRSAISEETDVLLHFDWVSADVRVASIMADDDKLASTFVNSDPYTAIMKEINEESDVKISREEAKVYLLKSINSLDIHSDVLSMIYPKLGDWIAECKAKMISGRPLETVLHKKFKKSKDRNELAVFNGVMQGSVAHAMQIVVRKIWECIGCRLIADIHDSLVISCPKSPAEIRAMIDMIAPIMLYPFNGVLPDNPSFPLKVNVGTYWKRWSPLEIHREAGVEKIAKKRQKAEKPVGQEEAIGEGTKKGQENGGEGQEEQGEAKEESLQSSQSS